MAESEPGGKGVIARRLFPILVGLAAIGVAAVIWVVLDGRRDGDQALIASGTVEATEAHLGFPTPGRIEAISVQEGDRVDVGDELALLDREETRARREQAVAQVAAAKALLRELERGFRSEEITQGRAALAVAAETLRDAQRDLDRIGNLLESRAVSQEAYDKAEVALDLARNRHRQAIEQVRILETGPRQEKIDAQRAQVAQAEASVRVIDATLNNMTVRAPFGGLVTVRHREPGEIVPSGAAILTVMNPEYRWVRIYIPETRIGAVKVGQSAAISSDTDPQKQYQGEVVFIAAQAEFTPKTVQTTEERVKLVYAAKVRITGDADYDLKPGMPADVRLGIGKP